MSASELTDLSRLAVHTFTNKPWSLRQCIDGYSKVGIRGISVWRNVLEDLGAKEAAKMLEDAGMEVPALVRGGFFPAFDSGSRREALDVNRLCIDEAAIINADMVVLVVGAVPGMSLPDARGQVEEALSKLLPYAEQHHMKLAIEPLHPMYADSKSCVNTMRQARQICDSLNHPLLGIAVDVYHTWWDEDLESEIELAAGSGLLFGFHICDWRSPTRDLLTDRALMGDGCINIREIRGWMEDAGFSGWNEVEIFSQEHWDGDQGEYVQKIVDAYLNNS